MRVEIGSFPTSKVYAYDRPSKIGQLDKALDEATAKGWAVVDMKNDWKTVFPTVNTAQ